MSGPPGPRYVNRWDIHGSLVPFAGRGVESFVFVFAGKKDHLESLCDRYLNEPTGGQVEYRLLTPLIALIFSRTKQLIAIDPPYSGMGWLPELEAAFWVLTAAVAGHGEEARADRLAWFVPYIFADSTLAVTEGREIFGFPKEIGWLEIPQDRASAERLTLDAHAVERFDSADLQGRRQRLLEVIRVDEASANQSSWPFNTVDDIARLFSELIGKGNWLLAPDRRFLVDLLGNVMHHRGRIVCLKQFSDVENSDRACYQAIVETPIEATALREGALLPGAYELVLNDFDSHPIMRDLGLEARQRAVLGYWLDFDFTFRPGMTIWKST